MNNNITFLDGALGTSLLKFIPAGGNIFELNINRPDLVEQLHREYIQAGSEIILANTFGINDFSATDTNYTTQELLTSALKIAKSATKGSSTKVALDIGPLIKLLEPYGDLTYEQCSSVYSNILSIVPLCKPDYIFFETFIDLKMLEIVVQLGNQYNIPILVSMSFLPIGKTIMGNSVEDFISAMQQYDNIIAVGSNCSDTPSKLKEVVKKFQENTDKAIIVKPNAGLPKFNSNISDIMMAENFAEEISYALSIPNIYIGGCCGTTPLTIKKLVEKYSALSNQ